MEGSSHCFTLFHGYGIIAFGGENFDSRADAIDLGSADEHHLSGMTVDLASADRAVDLTSVSVATHRDVESTQRALRRIGDFFGEHDCSGAGAKCGFRSEEHTSELQSQ